MTEHLELPTVPDWFEFHATGWICHHPHDPDDVVEELGHPQAQVVDYATAHLNEHHPGWDLRPEVARWIASAQPDGTGTPCGHYTAGTRTTCGATPTRQYISGRQCYDHRPAATRRRT